MRIGMFVDMYKPHVSGVTNYISMYKAALEERGHEVWVFTFGDRDYVDEEAHVVRSPGVPWGSTGWQFGSGFSPEARKLMAGLDVAHSHHPFLSGWLLMRTCRPLGIPIVFTNHTRYDLYADVYARFVPRALRQWFVRWWLAHFFAACDRVLAPSPEIAAWLADDGYVEGAHVLTNVIDVARYAEPDEVIGREALGFAPGDVVAVYLGRVGHEKRMLELADSFVLAAAEAPSLRLLALGDGPATGEFRERLRAGGVLDRVRFEGLVAPERVPAYLPVGDVFVSASVSETFPLVVIEAMAAGMPAVGAASPGVGEIVDHGRNGLLAADVGEFARELARVAGDLELRTRLSKQAATDAWQHDVNTRVLELLEVYERVRESER